MIYRNAIKYLHSAPTTAEIKPSADRIQLLCKYLGNPQKNLKYIRLAGSNGKTVCSQLLVSVLKEANIKTGCLNMPVRSDIKENIIVDSSCLTMEEVASYATAVAAAINQINDDIQKNAVSDVEGDEPQDSLELFTPTGSEIMLMMALLAFKENNCELCIIESDHNKADPSRFLPPPFSAVICGTIPSGDKKEISRIRSYICRGIQEIVSAPQNQEAYQVISDTCSSVNCRLTIPLKSEMSITRLALKATDFVYKNQEYSMRLCGRFEIANASVALETFDMLTRRGYNISYENVKKGLSKVSIPSKFEIISSTPYIIADSTHSPIAIETVCDSMTDFKELTGTKVRLCLPQGEIIHNYVKALNARGYDIEKIITVSHDGSPYEDSIDGIDVIAMKNFKQAAKEALNQLSQDTLLLISGPYSFTSEVRYEVLAIMNF